jgi:hypothetical protein
MKRIQEINSEITNFVKELERELDKEFRSTFKFWDSLFNISIVMDDNEISSIKIEICEFRNSAVFNIDSDQIRIYNSGSMNEDYKETILKVLNRF